jgi:hypothetical protein
MPWVKLDDTFPANRKIRRLSDGAFRLHITAICAAAHDLTDGLMTPEDIEDLASITKSDRRIDELVRRGLWEAVETGWLIHDYLDYNPSKVKVDTDREAARQRKIKWEETRSEHRSERVRNTSGTLPRTRPVPVPDPTIEETTTSDVAVAPIRPDVEAICSRLADRIEGNGSKRPEITKTWRTQARLLIDSDGRTEDQALRAIDWCQGDDFWRTNILSMGKFREKYDQLRLAASRPAHTDRQAALLRSEMALAQAADAQTRRLEIAR